MLDLLRRLIKRTERDVALAGAMVGSVTAMAKLFPTIEHYSTLKVSFYGGLWSSWDAWRDDGTPPTDAWQDFLRWYHGRPQSETYVFRHKWGMNMIRRCDIRCYDISHGEREKAK